MPRRDGTPTIAEQRAADRDAGNARFIAEATTEQLRTMLEPDDPYCLTDELRAAVRAELARRRHA